MRQFLKILGTAAVLSAVVIGVMAAPKRPEPQKPELVTIEFEIGGRKFAITGTVVPEENSIFANRLAAR